LQRDKGQFGTGLTWVTLIAWYLISAYLDSKDIPWWISIFLAAMVIAAVALIIRLVPHVTDWFKRNKRCQHGIRTSRIQCEACNGIALRERQRRQTADESQALHARERRRLAQAWLSKSESYFKMGSQEFENAIAALFTRLGYKVQQTPFSNDGGKDALAWKDGKKYLIECKRYAEDQPIGRRDLQILVAAMLEEKAEEGIYVNTGRFTGSAIAYALQNRIDLYDSTRLSALVNEAYGLPLDASRVDVMCRECGHVLSLSLGTNGMCRNGHSVVNELRIESVSVLGSLEPPKCKKCGTQMRIVKGSRGSFWGCSRYPSCRSTQSIPGQVPRFRRWRK